MLTAHILPMPTLDAERYVALFLTNPLLLAAFPDEMQAAAESWAGGYDKAATAALALSLSERRHRIALRTAVEAPQPEAERALLDLAAHPLIDKAERTRLQQKIMASRPSEYAWLKGILNAAILELDDERTARLLDPQAAPDTPQRRLDVALAAARGLGVSVVRASQLAAA